MRHGGQACRVDVLATAFAAIGATTFEMGQGMLDLAQRLPSAVADAIEDFVVLALDGLVAEIGFERCVDMGLVMRDGA